jgi:hypothetical protein
MTMDFSRFQVMPFAKGDTADETEGLLRMSDDAVGYLHSHSWCPQIEHVFLAFGVGDVVALFFVRFSAPLTSGDAGLWVVTGDVPDAYFVADDASEARGAMEVYCRLMSDWVKAVETGSAMDNVFPVRASATAENAHELCKRLTFIRDEIIPTL